MNSTDLKPGFTLNMLVYTKVVNDIPEYGKSGAEQISGVLDTAQKNSLLDYSGDLKIATDTLLDFMKRINHTRESIKLKYSDVSPCWTLTVSKLKKNGTKFDQLPPNDVILSDSLPHAICLGLLKMVGWT